jgi:hypothetical protein
MEQILFDRIAAHENSDRRHYYCISSARCSTVSFRQDCGRGLIGEVLDIVEPCEERGGKDSSSDVFIMPNNASAAPNSDGDPAVDRGVFGVLR